MVDETPTPAGTPTHGPGVSFYQQVQPFALEDEATLPNDKVIHGSAARVYNLLRKTRETGYRFPVGRHLAPEGGWVPTWVLREPWAGGSAGDRRLRGLRAAGVRIEEQAHIGEEDGHETRSWLWRLQDGAAAAGATPPAPQRTDLARLTFKTVYGAAPEGPGTTIDVTPGAQHPLAPSAGLWTRLGDLRDPEWSLEAAAERYRLELLDLWHAGTLLSGLSDTRRATFWADPACPFNPLPTLAKALRALGASEDA
ncbi:MAG TPA: hypothetical protein VNJ70_17995 [Thermoanaerobaculia bacterium]|nr:hypothetical protein [Thermoanaerobaculia bacterium]